MEEAERIAREEHGSGRIAVISGPSLGVGAIELADQQESVRGTITVDSGIDWKGRTWSKTCSISS